MDRNLLLHLPVVLAVARSRGFARAAAELGMGPSAVSHAVKTVEESLGTPLFARNTRSVALTEAGTAFVATAARAFQEIEDAIGQLRAAQGRVTGLLRLNVPRVALAIAMTPILAELAHRHPGLTVEVASDDALIDVVTQGFDAGVRLGEMIAQDMIAVRLTPPFRAVMVAAPGYLAARGMPASLSELDRHNCIGFRMMRSGGIYAWDVRADGQDIAVGVSGTVLVTDATYARDLALAGVGIAYVFEPLVCDELGSGRLIAVLPDTAIQEPGLFIYFPRSAARAGKLRAFLEVVKDVTRRQPAKPGLPPHPHPIARPSRPA